MAIVNRPPGSGLRVGLLRRGDRHTERPWSDRDFGTLIEAFAQLGIATQDVLWADDAVDEVREEIVALDGVIAWLLQIQNDGATREHLDPLLREVAAQGVFVSAHPDVIASIGTKGVLFATRELSWSSGDIELYASSEDFEKRFPPRLRDRRRLVLKQARGNTGIGVWKVELAGSPPIASPDSTVRVQEARRDSLSEETTLGAFMNRCEEYFAGSGYLVDQKFQERLSEGLVRCYLTHDEVVGFIHQWPKELLDSPEVASPRRQSLVVDADHPDYRALKAKVEHEWIPELERIVAVERHSLPVIWAAEFLFGPKTEADDDSYVLCEINCSATASFPLLASERIAAATLARIRDA